MHVERNISTLASSHTMDSDRFQYVGSFFPKIHANAGELNNICKIVDTSLRLTPIQWELYTTGHFTLFIISIIFKTNEKGKKSSVTAIAASNNEIGLFLPSIAPIQFCPFLIWKFKNRFAFFYFVKKKKRAIFVVHCVCLSTIIVCWFWKRCRLTRQ